MCVCIYIHTYHFIVYNFLHYGLKYILDMFIFESCVNDMKVSRGILWMFVWTLWLQSCAGWRRVCVYLIGVCAVLVFGSVRGVGEGLVAALVLTHIGFLSGVWAQVCFQILQTRVCLKAALELKHTHIHKAHLTDALIQSHLIAI